MIDLIHTDSIPADHWKRLPACTQIGLERTPSGWRVLMDNGNRNHNAMFDRHGLPFERGWLIEGARLDADGKIKDPELREYIRRHYDPNFTRLMRPMRRGGYCYLPPL